MPASAPGNLVIRAHAPLRRLAFVAGGVLLLALGLYVSYEFGRYDAGYDRQAVAQKEAEQTVLRERLEAENRDLRVKVAGFETTGVGAAREHAEVARTIGELQAQVARQAQDLAFLRGIVQKDAATPEVRVDQLRIVSTPTARHFQLRLNVVQPMRPEKVVSGGIDVQVDGSSREGVAQSLVLTVLTEGRKKDIPFNFKYFTNIDEPIVLPAGFRPGQVVVALRSARKGVAPVTQSFPWTVDAS